ncbi:CRISPR system precrRNA processing endoribonuclease RAMP protein Cas6 [Streptomyces sp. NPDC001680]
MPARWTLLLQAERPDAERPVLPAQLHGLAAHLLEGAGANHHAQHKPYTVSPLLAAPGPRGDTALLRLGWLPDTPRPDFTRLTGARVRLGAQFFTIASAEEEFTSYAGLLSIPPADRAVMRFRSATYFSRSGRWYPLPDPVLLYAGLIRRWNLFAPERARITETEEKELLGAVALSAHDITSQPVDLGAGNRIGFTGTAAFRLLGQNAMNSPQHFAALTMFATASGIGAQTTHGLGTVEVELQ